METNDLNAKMDSLNERMAKSHVAFFQQRFSFSWWLRGGEPGSPSDHLSLECESGRVKGEYITARFDGASTPPIVSREFSGEVPLSVTANLLRLVFTNIVFRTSDASNTGSSDMRDARKETWGFRNAEVSVARILTEPFPDDLAALRSFCLKIGEKLPPEVQHGR